MERRRAGRQRVGRVGLLALVLTAYLFTLGASAAGSAATTVDCAAGANLQTAIDNAAPGDTLRIRGTCFGNFFVNKNLTVEGAGGSPTLDGSGAGTVLTVQGGTIVQVVGLTITGGKVGPCCGQAAGISNFGGHVTLRESTVSGNTATGFNVGGIANGFNAELTLEKSTVSDNIGGGITNNSGGTLALKESIVSGNTNTGIFNNCGCRPGAPGCPTETLPGGTATIVGSTVSGNSADFAGGGIFNNGGCGTPDGTLTVKESTVTGNTVTGGFNTGGGIFNRGAATLEEIRVYGNSAGRGGGIFNDAGGELTLKGGRVSDNSAGRGGGIFNWAGGSATVEESTLSGNTASVNGGGIRNDGTMTLKESAVRDNSAQLGGGILNVSFSGSAGTLTLEESTVSSNTADFGGGIYNLLGTVAVEESTVTKNGAVTDGGGVFNDGGTVTLTESEVTKNSPNDCVGC